MLDVTCAVIIRNGRILITRRGPGTARAGKWEFPGGKMIEGESREECIVREIKEELSIDISVTEWLKPVEHSYPDIHIRLIPCMAEITDGSIQLTEHSKYEWVKIKNLLSYDWSPADIAVVDQLLQLHALS
jgi:8-oxo-dGTP diphosphatase